MCTYNVFYIANSFNNEPLLPKNAATNLICFSSKIKIQKLSSNIFRSNNLSWKKLICFNFLKIWSYTLFFFIISVFSLFSIVTFPNQGCASQDSSARNGTCYTSSECQNKGGTSSGNCAAG